MLLLLFFKGLNTYTKMHVLNWGLLNMSFIHLKVMTLTGDHFQFSHIWTSYWSLAGVQMQICIRIYTHLKKERRRKHTWWGSTKISLVCTQKSRIIYRQRTWVDSQEVFITCNTLMYPAFASVLGRRCMSDASYQCRQPCPMNVPLQGYIY